MIFNRFRKGRGDMQQVKRDENRELFEKLLQDMGFLPENVHYAHTSLHEGFPEKAWYFPRPDDDRESLALIAVYDDGAVVLREYEEGGGKPEHAWSLGNLNTGFDRHRAAMLIEEKLEKQRNGIEYDDRR